MEPEVVELEPQKVAMIRKVIPMSEIRDFYDTAFGDVFESVSAAGGVADGPPFGWYRGMPSDTVDVAAGIPVIGLDEGSLAREVEVVERAGGRAVVAVHVGSYDRLPGAYAEIQAWMAERELEPRPEMWEEYLTEPTPDADPEAMETRIVWPLA